MLFLVLVVGCTSRPPVPAAAPAPIDAVDALRRELAAIAAPSGIDDLGRVLAARREVDQRVRNVFMAGTPEERAGELGAQLRAVDAENTAFLKGWVAEHGWPKISDVGDQAAHNAWLLAQHADADPAFQADVLQRMGALVETGDATAKDYGYLWDRVALAADRPQRYATQGACQGPRWAPANLEDPDGIEARRAEIGLGPLDAYRDRFDCDRHEANAKASYEAGEFAACEVAYAAHAETRVTREAAAASLYNAACCAARAGRVDAAFGHLESALDRGFSAGKVAGDSDLESLRQDPRWGGLFRPR